MSQTQETNTLRSSTTRVLRKRYAWLLALIGVPGIGDFVRDYVRGKVVDYTLSRLGWFGDLLVANPVALTEIGILLALIVLTVMVTSESSRQLPSPIYENAHRPFMKPPTSRRWLGG